MYIAVVSIWLHLYSNDCLAGTLFSSYCLQCSQVANDQPQHVASSITTSSDIFFFYTVMPGVRFYLFQTCFCSRKFRVRRLESVQSLKVYISPAPAEPDLVVFVVVVIVAAVVVAAFVVVVVVVIFIFEV
ncbi:unnamed protein product, partial [Polarella glacialis]